MIHQARLAYAAVPEDDHLRQQVSIWSRLITSRSYSMCEYAPTFNKIFFLDAILGGLDRLFCNGRLHVLT